MPDPKVAVVGGGYALLDAARVVLERAGARVEHVQSRDMAEIAACAREADAVMAFLLPMPATVIDRLERCRVIVRLGVGYDNIDLEAARARGIPVCNVPDYGTDEVADHALALALALIRQLPLLDRSIRAGDWLSEPPLAMPPCEEMTFGVIGYGRIGRAAMERARTFKFRLAACDPYLPDAAFAPDVARRTLEEILAEADILSLHVPLTLETRHLLNAARLAQMKSTALLVNTARGPVVDTQALAEALRTGRLAAAGLDVFEEEPLAADHPLRACHNALLTPHQAWYSARSRLRLHTLAAEEVARGLRGEPLRNVVNGVEPTGR